MLIFIILIKISFFFLPFLWFHVSFYDFLQKVQASRRLLFWCAKNSRYTKLATCSSEPLPHGLINKKSSVRERKRNVIK